MIEEMKKMNTSLNTIKAKIAGGAKMFSFPTNGASVGDRNVEKTIEILKKHKIKIIGEDVGQNYGRTVEFHVSDGKMVIKKSNEVLKVL